MELQAGISLAAGTSCLRRALKIQIKWRVVRNPPCSCRGSASPCPLLLQQRNQAEGLKNWPAPILPWCELKNIAGNPQLLSEILSHGCAAQPVRSMCTQFYFWGFPLVLPALLSQSSQARPLLCQKGLPHRPAPHIPEHGTLTPRGAAKVPGQGAARAGRRSSYRPAIVSCLLAPRRISCARRIPGSRGPCRTLPAPQTRRPCRKQIPARDRGQPHPSSSSSSLLHAYRSGLRHRAGSISFYC